MSEKTKLEWISDICLQARQMPAEPFKKIKIEPATQKFQPEVSIEITNWREWEKLLLLLLKEGALLTIEDKDTGADNGSIYRRAVGNFMGIDFCLKVSMNYAEQKISDEIGNQSTPKQETKE